MYQTLIKIKKTTPSTKLKMLTTIITGLFNNRAGTVPNTSPDPYTLVFAGDDRDWACLDLGTLALEDVPGLLDYISECYWLDEDPNESCDVLKVFATPVR